MAYYRGDYYRGKGRGDYYRGKGRGDPGFWSAIGRGLGVVGASIAAPYTGGASLSLIPSFLPGGMPKVPALGQGGIVPNSSGEDLKKLLKMGPPGSQGPFRPDVELMPGMTRRRYRRMNPANVKALRRSIRRLSGFGRLVKSARGAVAKAATSMQVHRHRAVRMLPPGRK